MSNVTVCARFRPRSSKEMRDPSRDGVCARPIDAETFVFQDDKEDEFTFSLDRVFYEDSTQAAVYEFLALPIMRDFDLNLIVSCYTMQTGAGKTYSMEGPGIQDCDEHNKGLLPRVVHGMFEQISSSNDIARYTVKLSMVEIYMEKVRDLLDLSKANIQIKENKTQGILLSGVTEASFIVLYLLFASVEKNLYWDSVKDKRVKTGKLILVDLAGSEKADKTGAEGRVLEEAKTINKSLSALGNVINALTSGPSSKGNHIPYRDSKLTRILQDALGGNSRMALLCCCSPSTLNASETLSTLRFGMRAKHIKASPRASEVKSAKAQEEPSSVTKDEKCGRILEKMKERMSNEDIKMLEDVFIQEGIIFSLDSMAEVETVYEDIVSKTIQSLQQAVDELQQKVKKLEAENIGIQEQALRNHEPGSVGKMSRFISSWYASFFTS
ncbi:kinesin heavy chain-like protein [Arabidopsis thaliana]|nr:kinesin heavy chain-like protein [Arabidopsis thaliana]